MDGLYIKILYFDSSALLSYLIKDVNNQSQDGGIVVADIINKAGSNAYSLNVSDMVIYEIEKKQNCILPYYKKLLSGFNIVTGKKEQQEKYLQLLLNKYPDLSKKRNSQDLNILSQLYYLELFSGPSHPILVSCDNLMNKIALTEGYRIFNPRNSIIDVLINM